MIRAELVHVPIDPGVLIDTVADPSCGAISLFLGTVRDLNEGRGVTGIEYTAYQTMAVRELQRIATEAAERYAGIRVAVVHRIGELGLGDVSVAIAVAHAHRGAAIDAGRYVIEELKRRVPIWKREHYTDGTHEWVNAANGSVAEVPR